MRITKVEIKRFLGTKSLSIDVDRAVQVIAGPNNSGKTTFLKAVELFFSGKDSHDPKSFAPKNDYYEEEGNRSKTYVKVVFCDLSKTEVASFKHLLDVKGRLQIELGITKGGSAEYHFYSGKKDDEAVEKIIGCHEVMYVPVTRTYEKGAASIHSDRLGGLVKDLLIRSRRGSHAYDLFKQIQGSISEIRKVIDGVLNESKSSIERILPDAVDIRFGLPIDEEVIDFVASDIEIKSRGREDISLSDEGAGFQSLMSLGLIKSMADKKRKNANVILLIEEPEAFLHPQYQRKIVDFIFDLSKRHQIFVTTHSHVVVDSIDIKCVARFKRMPDGLVQDIRSFAIDDAEAGKLMRHLGRGNSELVFADKVILCEGESDASVVKKLISKLKKEGLSPNVSVISMGSADLSLVYKRICHRFSVDSFLILDRDKAVASGRSSIKAICRLKGKAISKSDFDTIDEYHSVAGNSHRSALMARKKINEYFQPCNVFFFASDLEYALVNSIKRDVLTGLMTKSGYVKKNQVQEINSLKEGDFMDEASILLHSKGRDLMGNQNKEKLKPHIPAVFVAEAGMRFVAGSDLAFLEKCIGEFLRYENI